MTPGLLFAFLSGCAVATSSLVVKLASDHACSVLQSTLYRNVFMISVLGVLLIVAGDTASLFRTPRKTMVWMCVRSVVSFVALVSVYALYRLIPLGKDIDCVVA